MGPWEKEVRYTRCACAQPRGINSSTTRGSRAWTACVHSQLSGKPPIQVHDKSVEVTRCGTRKRHGHRRWRL